MKKTISVKAAIMTGVIALLVIVGFRVTMTVRAKMMKAEAEEASHPASAQTATTTRTACGGVVAQAPALSKLNPANHEVMECGYVFGRIILSDKVQAFDVFEGEQFQTAPVEDHVEADRVVNGTKDLGQVILIRSATERPKNYGAAGHVFADGYKAHAAANNGQSIVYIKGPYGTTLPDRSIWVSKAVRLTSPS